MAIQTLDMNKYSPGEQILRGLGTGLTSGLERLAKNKMEEIGRQRTAAGLGKLGFEQEEAEGISQLAPDMQKEIVKDMHMADREGRKSSSLVVKNTLAAERGARDNLHAIKRIEELDRSGKIQGLTGELLKKAGLGRLRTPETQELEKLSVGMLSNLKNIFGSRPTNLDVKLFMESIPTLVQSAEGRARIIRNLRAANEASQIRGQAMREILKENKGRTPSNLELQIEDRVGDRLDRLNAEISDSPGTPASQQMNDLPDPSSNQGKKVRDTVTGQILVSNGQQWVPQGA